MAFDLDESELKATRILHGVDKEDEEKEEALAETEIRFRANLLILNSEFPTHRKTEAMEELLEIYNKQQADLTTVYINGFYDGEKKVKDKIKVKIEELEDMYNELPKNPKEHLHSKTEYKIVIGVLQSLLEKE